MKSERAAWLFGLALIWAGGCLVAPQDSGNPTERRPGAWALAGGYRPLAADWFWLQADLAWERRDAPATRLLIGLTLAADPQSRYFWLNSARMLAYDLPTWSDSSGAPVEGPVRAQRRKAGAEEALQLLRSGMRWHPDSAELHLEMGNICLYALGDRARAAVQYRLAAEQPGAPAYAGRIYRRLQTPRR